MFGPQTPCGLLSVVNLLVRSRAGAWSQRHHHYSARRRAPFNWGFASGFVARRRSGARKARPHLPNRASPNVLRRPATSATCDCGRHVGLSGLQGRSQVIAPAQDSETCRTAVLCGMPYTGYGREGGQSHTAVLCIGKGTHPNQEPLPSG